MGFSEMDDKAIVLGLLATPRIGRKTALAFLQEHEDAMPGNSRELLEALQKLVARRSRKISESLGLADIETAIGQAIRTLDRAGKGGIGILVWKDFPDKLKRIPDPPVALYYKGDYRALSDNGFAVIGTRSPTPQGVHVANRMAYEIAQMGYSVVSGLATGCDTAAHRGCLDAGGVTVAVLAHGLDHVFPPENADLAKEIIGKKGCIVSEYAPEVKPSGGFFIERDRIQSGLSLGVLVAETGLKSGTLHTVTFAEAQERPVACWEPGVDAQPVPESRRGNLELISSGRARAIKGTKSLSSFIDFCLPVKDPDSKGIQEKVQEPAPSAAGNGDNGKEYKGESIRKFVQGEFSWGED